MRIPARILIVLAGLGLALGYGPSASADGQGYSSYVNGSLGKLGRGIANVLTCAGELPRVTSHVWQRNGTIAAATVGITQGLGRVVYRGIAGAYEILTFPLEIPNDFKPLIQPEFVFADSDWTE